MEARSTSVAATDGSPGVLDGGHAAAATALETLRQNAREATALLKALGNANRLMVLCHLCQGERSVTQLEALVGLSQSALSQHLARLRRDRLVVTRRAAQTIYYSIGSAAVQRVLGVLYDLYCGPGRGAGDAQA